MTGEREVAAVVGGHGHNGAGAVIRQHIVADPDGDALFGDGVDGVCTGEDAAHLLDLGLALTLRAVLGPGDVSLYLGFLLRRGDAVNEFVLGAQHHERHPKDGIRPGGENLKCRVIRIFNFQFSIFIFQREPNRSTLAPAYPVPLDLLQRIGPVYLLQTIDQALGVSRHAKTPLAHQFALHRVASSDTQTVDDLVVGQHGTQFGAPVHGNIGQISQTIVHQHLLTLRLVPRVPLLGAEIQHLSAGSIKSLGALLGETLHE